MPTIEEFGKTIKQKYPQYNHVDDKELGMKMLDKYPQYKEKVFDTDPDTQQKLTQDKPTEGVWDAVKKGASNIVSGIKQSGSQLDETLNANVNPLIKTAKTATTLVKGMINPIVEAGIATPMRIAGETIQSGTGFDINEFTSQGVQRLVQKGMETETAQKAMQGWAKLKETDPESAMALSAALDIADIASNAIGAKGVTMAANAVEGGVKTAGKVVAGKVDDLARIGAKKVVPKATALAGKTGEFATAQTFGFNPETVKTIIKNPEYFTPKEMAKIDRESVFTKVKDSVEKRLEDLSETGKGYEAIKKSGEKVVFKENPVPKVLSKYGIGIDDSGKVVTTAESVPLGTGDINAIEGFVRQYGTSELSSNGFLNARKALSNMSKFGSDKTDAAVKIARDLRSEYDSIGKKTLTGLAEIDAKYAPEVKLMKNIKKIVFNADGSIKDTAISRIANITGKGKEQLLSRMEKVIPGISRDVNILKAIEDINAAGGQKVGAYMRTAAGIGTGAITGGPVGAIIGAILTSPQMGVAILRSYAKYKGIPREVLNRMIKKMESGKKLVGTELQTMNEAVDNAAKKAGARITPKTN